MIRKTGEENAMLRLGIPSMIELKTVEQSAALCRELGLSFVELNTNFPNQQPHLLDGDMLLQWAEQHGISYTIHLNDELNVADFNPYVAKGYRDSVLEAIDLAKKIGAKVLNMHLSGGAYYTMPDRKIHFFEAYREEYLAGMAQFRDLCTRAVGDSDIHICVENTTGYKSFQLEALAVLLESPVFGLTLDIGHNCCAGFADEPWILERDVRLHHFHIHDVLNGTKDHLPLGSGSLDVEKYLSLADTLNATAVLEVKTVQGLRTSVDWLKKRL